MEQLEPAAALAKYKPCLVLCAWLPSHSDTEVVRLLAEHGAREYLMIGCLATTPGSRKEACPKHAMQLEHEGYSRSLLEDVSSQLLHVTDAQRDPHVPRGTGLCCAVAYRRA